jgi:DeoR/GlpR family transcriptional regulator of sugar metabolism
MKAEPRREQILKLLEKTGILSVGELADRFALSVVTIRKDLDDLASEGLLQRTFGGAVFSNGSLFNSSFRESARQHDQQKHAIATAAMEYIQDGDTVILDSGTTTLALAKLLREQVKSAFIITCSVPAALELSSAGYDILLLGGMVGNKSLALLGPETLTILEVTGRTKHFSVVRVLLPKADTARQISNMHRSKKPSYGLPNRRMSS